VVYYSYIDSRRKKKAIFVRIEPHSSPAAAPATPLRPRRGPAPPTATPLGDYSSSALWRNNVAVLRLWMGGGSAAVEAQTPRQGVDDKIL
jgi:hypothetical protein